MSSNTDTKQTFNKLCPYYSEGKCFNMRKCQFLHKYCKNGNLCKNEGCNYGHDVNYQSRREIIDFQITKIKQYRDMIHKNKTFVKNNDD